MRTAFKYRLFTNKTQQAKLESLFDAARFLYNCALEQRIVCWKQWRKSINYYDQANTLKEIRSFNEGIANLNYSASQDILRRLDKSFQAFFRRIKCGDTPGFPRFKGRDRFDSITFPAYGDGIRLKNGKLYIQNVGSVRIKLHRNLEGKIKTVTIKRQNGHFYACFSCDDVPQNILPASADAIGIDVGIKSFAVMSNGETVDNPKHLKQSEEKLKDLQRKHSKKHTRKTRKALSRLHEKVSNQRSDFHHKLSRKIVNSFGLICVEKLQPSKMLNSFKVLNKFINDAAWSQFFNDLRYKAEGAGRAFVEVNPKNTTQACSACGKIVPKDLSVRVHKCPFCGLILNRDYNAALNILGAGQALCLAQEAVCFS
jgi:putative transposase